MHNKKSFSEISLFLLYEMQMPFVVHPGTSNCEKLFAHSVRYTFTEWLRIAVTGRVETDNPPDPAPPRAFYTHAYEYEIS